MKKKSDNLRRDFFESHWHMRRQRENEGKIALMTSTRNKTAVARMHLPNTQINTLTESTKLMKIRQERAPNFSKKSGTNISCSRLKYNMLTTFVARLNDQIRSGHFLFIFTNSDVFTAIITVWRNMVPSAESPCNNWTGSESEGENVSRILQKPKA